ncbi:MAG: DUF3307 domain-containing protein [Chloroflexi bacterium]|nr:DUF3307 domain-containing protein [Chloroflexota bacterium]
MSTLLVTLVRRPASLLWWQWGKVLGLVAPFGAFAGRAVLAIALHVLCDFTLQNDWMAVGKARKEIVPLLIHSLIAGGLPGLVAGGLPGAAVGIISHFLIDLTGKFGLSEPWGPVLDQAAHIVILVLAGCL